ncbi:hypothetical protein [Methanoculleus caldifontis]|nr:hypothetical protein [Methanoculleus sp. Wushi-C6]
MTAGSEAVYRMNPGWVYSQVILTWMPGGEVIERFGTAGLLSPDNHLLAVRELKKICMVLFLSCSTCSRAGNPGIPVAQPNHGSYSRAPAPPMHRHSVTFMMTDRDVRVVPTDGRQPAAQQCRAPARVRGMQVRVYG